MVLIPLQRSGLNRGSFVQIYIITSRNAYVENKLYHILLIINSFLSLVFLILLQFYLADYHRSHGNMVVINNM